MPTRHLHENLHNHSRTQTQQTNIRKHFLLIHLLCPATKVLETVFIPTLNLFLGLEHMQQGFCPLRSSASALTLLVNQIATSIKQQKLLLYTVVSAVDLSAPFDSFSSQPHTVNWFSNLRDHH